jgi:hypothetical protein
MENLSLNPNNPVPVAIQDAAQELHRLVANSGLEDYPEAGQLEEAISRFICINEHDPLD